MTKVALAPLVDILSLTSLATEGGSFSIFLERVPGLALIGPAWSLPVSESEKCSNLLGLLKT